MTQTTHLPPYVTANAAFDAPSANESSRLLPAAALADVVACSGHLLRRELIDLKQKRVELRNSTAKQLRHARSPDEKDELHEQIRRDTAQTLLIEDTLQDCFVPQHSERQLLGARALFVSPLFHVRSKSTPRRENVELQLTPADCATPIRYQGPELRQSDARVFLALVNILRDMKLGVTASFPVREMCEAIFGRHDGDTRRQLREHIRRLHPDGQCKFPRLWPPQTPPGKDGGIMTGRCRWPVGWRLP